MVLISLHILMTFFPVKLYEVYRKNIRYINVIYLVSLPQYQSDIKA